ncbi:patatin-like phospholipase family protein [Legionella spiritensis]|uniref:patatin-like phospholipase family protein n=1 Tax=Legionella spiritensis TaxID=452 RepID=UPI000F6DE9B7|nr:patatin-like phospholipase family protein [Legionella spiritensis]VEG92275.1 patatin-like phospholipase [Legionella spiritensis]
MVASKKNKKLPHKDALGLINKPEKSTGVRQKYDRIACVFQGGGALGAFQVGAFRAIHEQGYRPNFYAGVSIGSINSSIIAGNPPEKQIDKLMEFWDTIVPDLWSDAMATFHNIEFMHHLHNRISSMAVVFQGLEGFFRPRLVPPTPLTRDTPDKLSYYDTSPLKHTLEKLIDFDLINDKHVTLCLGAVNIATGQMEFFNNQKMTITPEHVMASGALPPGFPAIKIDDDYYWDGGIYANTPLVTVLDALPEQDTLCFVIDCFSLEGQLPITMDQLEERQKDIRYASHSRRLTNVYTSRQNLQAAIQFLGTQLPAEVKKDPEIQKILKLGHEKRFSVVHIIYSGTPYSHSYKDYNFAHYVIDLRLREGYENAMKVLKEPEWENKTEKKLACSIYGVSSDYFDQH